MIDTGIESARETEGMTEETFVRALMYQLLEYNKKTREDKDLISELEQYIKQISDGGEAVITRGS